MEELLAPVLEFVAEVVFTLLVAPFHPRSTIGERLTGSAVWVVVVTVGLLAIVG